MPAEWYDNNRCRGGLPIAESPDADPVGDGPGEADGLLAGGGYRRNDRDSVFDGLMQRLDLVAVMVTVVIAGVTGYVGIELMQNTVDTAGLNFNETDRGQNTGFENSTLDLTLGLEDFFSQLGTVFVVIVLVVIIGYLMLLRGR